MLYVLISGAVSNSRGGALGNGLQYVMDNIACDEHAQSIVECDWETPSDCGPSQAAGVECWHNKGNNRLISWLCRYITQVLAVS